MVAYAPRDCALLAGSGRLVGLTLDTQVHDVVSADGAVIHNNIPCPKRNSIPLLDLEFLLSIDLLPVCL